MRCCLNTRKDKPPCHGRLIPLFAHTQKKELLQKLQQLFHFWLLMRLLALFTENIETEQLCFVLGFLALEMSIADLAAFNKACQTDKLAKLALEVESVSFISYEENISLTFINFCKKSLYVNIM